jgi:hypothetical protein
MGWGVAWRVSCLFPQSVPSLFLLLIFTSWGPQLESQGPRSTTHPGDACEHLDMQCTHGSLMNTWFCSAHLVLGYTSNSDIQLVREYTSESLTYTRFWGAHLAL